MCQTLAGSGYKRPASKSDNCILKRILYTKDLIKTNYLEIEMTDLLTQAIEILPTQMKHIQDAAAALNGKLSVYHVYPNKGDIEIQVQIDFDHDIQLQDFVVELEKNPEYKASLDRTEFNIHDNVRISMNGGYGANGIDSGERNIISFRLSDNPMYL